MKIYRIAKKLSSNVIWYLLKMIYMKHPIGHISDGALIEALGETDDEEIIQSVLDETSVYFLLTHNVLKNPLSWKYSSKYHDKVIDFLNKVRESGGFQLNYYIDQIGDPDFKLEALKESNLIEQEDPNIHKVEEVPEQKGGVEDLEKLLAKGKGMYRIASSEKWLTIKWMENLKLKDYINWNSVEKLFDQLKTTKDREIMEYALENIEQFPANVTLFAAILQNPISWQYPDKIKRAIGYYQTLGGQGSYGIQYWVKYIGDIDLRLALLREFGAIDKEDIDRHRVEEVPEQKGGVEELRNLLSKSNNWYGLGIKVLAKNDMTYETVKETKDINVIKEVISRSNTGIMEDEILFGAALANPICPVDVLVNIHKSRLNEFSIPYKERVLENPNCPPNILGEVVESKKMDYLRYIAAANPNCPTQSLEKAINITNFGDIFDLGMSIVKNPKCPMYLLVELMEEYLPSLFIADYNQLEQAIKSHPNFDPSKIVDASFEWKKRTGIIQKEDPTKHKIEEVENQKGGVEELENLLAKNWYRNMKTAKLTSQELWSIVEDWGRINGFRLHKLSNGLRVTDDGSILEYMLKNVKTLSEKCFYFDTDLYLAIISNPISWQYPDAIRLVLEYARHRMGWEESLQMFISPIKDADLRIQLMREFDIIKQEDPDEHKIEEVPEQKGGVKELESLLSKSSNWYKIATTFDEQIWSSGQLWNLIKKVESKVPFNNIGYQLSSALKRTNDEKIIQYALQNIRELSNSLGISRENNDYNLVKNIISNPLSWQYPNDICYALKFAFDYESDVVDFNSIKSIVNLITDNKIKVMVAKELGLVEFMNVDETIDHYYAAGDITEEDPTTHKIEDVPEQKGGVEDLEKLLSKSNNWYKIARKRQQK